MAEHFSEERYADMLNALFQRFPSFQKVGSGAYKPGIGNMEFIDQLLGHPHRDYKVITLLEPMERVLCQICWPRL